ncbi:MAG: hypothetical protein QF847_01400 [Candidatus Marinimicrobia bacterium]|nr:hypothetical protein [Candidatus Neomarinimicrobiota bacterium]MDP6612251.1 hypothetical protein [Candidatus Neomarinimicrobiota bacterium]MDP6725890.1 hypothetical protein [Candidatus Neomarinimicrobiota bacterium]
MKKEGIIALGWTVLAFCIGIFLVVRESSSNVQSIFYGRLPEFHLIDTQGQDFNYNDIIGKIWVVQFSNDPLADFPELPSGVEALTILTNSSQIKMKHSNSKIVHSDKGSIFQLGMEGFHLSEKLLEEGHSIPFILVDKTGNIRGYYQPDKDKDIKKLSRDIDSLLQFS